jgi:hypothetical protein
MRASLAQYSIDQLFERPEITTRERLAEEGFSAAMIDRFFRPFFGGIFLEPELRTTSRASISSSGCCRTAISICQRGVWQLQGIPRTFPSQMNIE